MRVLVAGAGPAGLVLGAALARRGHDVVAVDRDPGPTDSGWARRGVMQFAHAHGFRPQVPALIAAEWPAGTTQSWPPLTPRSMSPAELSPIAPQPSRMLTNGPVSAVVPTPGSAHDRVPPVLVVVGVPPKSTLANGIGHHGCSIPSGGRWSLLNG